MVTSIKESFRGLYRPCQCGCGYLIHVINRRGFARYKSGHNPVDVSKRRTYSKENNPFWKGGIKKKGKYLAILRHHHKYKDYWGYVFLHRYRMELMLGRYLTKEEVVHHIDGDKKNNEESNLMLFANNSEHRIFEQTKDMTGRICIKCGTDKTYFSIHKDGKKQFHWSGNELDGFICNKCSWKIWYRAKKSS